MAGQRRMIFTKWLPEGISEAVAVEQFQGVVELLQKDSGVLYFAVNCEVGKTEKPHIHGYVYFEKPQGYSRLKKILADNSLHCDFPRGTVAENIDYLSHTGKHQDKSGRLLCDVVEFGKRPHDDKGRPAWQTSEDSGYGALIEGLRLGKTDAELMELFPLLYVRYFHNVQRLRELIQSQGLYIKVSE